MRIAKSVLSVAVMVAVTLVVAGCDSKDLDSLVKDVSEQVSEVTESAPKTPAGESGSTTDVVSQLPAIAAPAVPPEQLVAELMATKPSEINGTILKSVAAVPEAASQIIELDVSGAILADEDVASIGAFKNLQTLKMTATGDTTEVGLRVVGKLPALASLTLVRSKADDSVLAEIGNLSRLRMLDLEQSQITGAGLRHLAANQELQELNIQSTRIDDAGVGALVGLPIHTLNVKNSAIGDAGLAEIAKIPTLQVLNVAQTRVTGEGFKVFAKSQLKSLNASTTKFGTEGLISIRGMKSLEELFIYQSGIVEHEKANVFRTLPNLRVLHIGANAISDQGMHVFFKGLRNLEQLEISTTPGLSNAGLEALITCRNLNYVDMRATKVTSAAMAHLKKILKKPEMTTFP